MVKLIEIDQRDIETLAQYCETFARYTHLQSESLTTPYTYAVGTNGAKAVDPLFQQLNKERELLLKYSRRFGLDPESRKMQKEKIEQEIGDEWADVRA